MTAIVRRGLVAMAMPAVLRMVATTAPIHRSNAPMAAHRTTETTTALILRRNVLAISRTTATAAIAATLSHALIPRQLATIRRPSALTLPPAAVLAAVAVAVAAPVEAARMVAEAEAPTAVAALTANLNSLRFAKSPSEMQDGLSFFVHNSCTIGTSSCTTTAQLFQPRGVS